MSLLKTLENTWDREGPRPLAFDGDGTLWTGDVAERVWDALLHRRLVRDEARPALQAEAQRAGLDDTGDVHTLCKTLEAGYLEHRLDEERFCEVQAWVFAGWRKDELAPFIDEVLFHNLDGHVALSDEYIPETLAIVRAAQARQVPVLVVSASPAHIVERAVRPLGISQVYGSRVRWQGDTVLPEVERPICYGPGKVWALNRALEGAQPLAAFGDNLFDLHMLLAAQIGVMVRPKPRLFERPEAAQLHRLPRA